VGQAVSGAIGNSFGTDAFGQFAKRAVSGFAAGTAAAVMRGGKIAIQQVATDAFGNALGQSLAENTNGAGGSVASGNGGRLDEETARWLGQELGLRDDVRYPGVDVAAADKLEVLPLPGDSDELKEWVDRKRQENAERRRQEWGRNENAVGRGVQYQLGTAPTRMTETPILPDAGLINIPSILADYVPQPEAYQPMSPAESFRRSELEQASAQDFQLKNDQKVTAGTYDRFDEIGRTVASRNWGEALRHFNYDASDAARRVATERVYPPMHPDIVRIDRMIASPWGAGVAGVAGLAGASQRTQDLLLGVVGAAEQYAGARTGVYKQTLTAAPPSLVVQGLRSRGPVGGPTPSAAPLDPILQAQKDISIATQKKASAVDRWLRVNDSRLAQTYRDALETNPNFASMIRGRIIDRRMNAWFKDQYGNVPGVRIDQQIPGSGMTTRPDLYLPELGGKKVIFDVGGPSKITDILKYEGQADYLFPITH
jgi:hypothetical protein